MRNIEDHCSIRQIAVTFQKMTAVILCKVRVQRYPASSCISYINSSLMYSSITLIICSSDDELFFMYIRLEVFFRAFDSILLSSDKLRPSFINSNRTG